MRKVIGGMVVMIATMSSVFAAPSAPEDLRALEVSDSSIQIDWQDTNGAIGYYIYHGTSSGVGGSYDIEGVELIESSDYTLEGLSPDTNYFIAVTAIDEFGTESPYSEELQYSTLEVGAESEATNFRIKDVSVIDESSLEFIFSNDLDASPEAVMEFIVEEKISGKEIPIDISQVNEDNTSNVIVILGEELVPALEYKVIVLDVKDASGNTIESGIDAFISFIMPVITETEEPVAEDPEVEEDTPVEEDPEVEEESSLEEDTDLLAAGDDEDVAGLEVSGGNAGTTLSNEELNGSITQAAQDNNKLPQTGPEHWMLLFIAILIASGIYTIRNKKYSS